MKVLVVGGAGYVGGALTDMLVESEHKIRVYDALLYEESYRKPVEFVFGDIRDVDCLKRNTMWADVVVWLAALVGDGACQLNPEISVAINQTPVNWISNNFGGRIIFMSTCSVYGAQSNVVLTEDCPTDPLSVYATTKLAAESYLAGHNAIIFRLGTLFGVGDEFSRLRLDLVVNTLTVRAWQHGKVSVFGGDQFRPLLHVRDAAKAVLENLDSVHTGVYNLHRQNVRIIDLAYQVRNHFPDLMIEQTDLKFQDTRNYRVDSRKAQDVLGFRPVHSIDDGIEQIKFLLDTNRLRHLSNPRYTNQSFLSMFNPHKVVLTRALA